MANFFGATIGVGSTAVLGDTTTEEVLWIAKETVLASASGSVVNGSTVGIGAALDGLAYVDAVKNASAGNGANLIVATFFVGLANVGSASAI